MNLSGMSLRWMDLSWMDLSGADLRGAKLSGVTLHQTTFSLEALLRYSDRLTDERLPGIVFAGLSEDLRRPDVR
ncbi:pentapeptide repeat-containing protein, partial [Paraburkholderia sp. RL17-373-BIF-A]